MSYRGYKLGYFHPARLSRPHRVGPALVAVACLAVAPIPRAADTAPDAVIATVDDAVISDAQLNEALARSARTRYYHGAPPEDLRQQLRKEVANELIDRLLLLREARRRGITASEEQVDKTLAAYRKRYEKAPEWPTKGERLLQALGDRLREDNVLQQLEAQVRNVPPPGESELQDYYAQHHDKFTEPEQDRLSVILLKVDPSAPASAWEAARREAADLVVQLRGGADFSEMARLRSGDSTAAQGGDMGYLHRGMLSAAAEEVTARLNLGEVSDPVRVLEGVAIFRLEDRKPSLLRTFADVRERARDLWLREHGDQAWAQMKSALRAASVIKIQDASLASDRSAVSR